MQRFVVAAMVVISDKFIGQKYKDEIKEWLKLTAVGRLYQEELEKKDKDLEKKDKDLKKKDKDLKEKDKDLKEKDKDLKETKEDNEAAIALLRQQTSMDDDQIAAAIKAIKAKKQI
ncbi:MAG: hypothetical protein LBC41_18570 [Clostridiales bacterium]|jgi:hypothetical protein|nr:hypothetical protein [Clostridiales bacterium]